MKKIPAPIDVKGRQISFRPSESSDILFGEVLDVFYRPGIHPKYPKGSQGYKNGMRQSQKKITVILADGRVLNMPAEQEDVKRYRMVAENQKEEMTW